MKKINGIWLPDKDTHFEKMMKPDGSYQKDIFKAAMEYIAAPKLFYDIGAHVGLWSLMARNAGFKHIFAFEPNPETFECYQTNLGKSFNVQRESYEIQIVSSNYAISATSKRLKLIREKENNSGAVRLGRAESFITDADTVPCVTLNSDNLHDLIDKYQIAPQETLVKIDVEGMEADCVLAIDKVLYAFRPVVIVEQRTNLEALDILQQMGMQIVKQIRKDYILTWKDL